jgi:hypothetical protein
MVMWFALCVCVCVCVCGLLFCAVLPRVCEPSDSTSKYSDSIWISPLRFSVTCTSLLLARLIQW